MTPTPRRSLPATLSPAARCWWERRDDCAYLVLVTGEDSPHPVRLELTYREAGYLGGLLTDPGWWNDADALDTQTQGERN